MRCVVYVPYPVTRNKARGGLSVKPIAEALLVFFILLMAVD